MRDNVVLDETMLDATTSTAISKSYSTKDCRTLTFHTIASSVSSGAVVEIQSSLDDTNWVTINDSAKTISSSGNTEFKADGVKYKFVRANISTYTDGTYSVKVLGGN